MPLQFLQELTKETPKGIVLKYLKKDAADIFKYISKAKVVK